MIDHLMLLSIPGLRPGDLRDPNLTPTLYRLAMDGGWRDLVPTFPCLAAPVQASMLTGVGPHRHGLVADGLYEPDLSLVDFQSVRYDAIQCPTFFTTLAEQRPGSTSALWHSRPVQGAHATYVLAPAPVAPPHAAAVPPGPPSQTSPRGWYEQLSARLGPFPRHPDGRPLADLRATRWIFEGALWLADHYAPNFQYLCIRHLDDIAQIFGPDSAQAAGALSELDHLLADFMERYGWLPLAANTAWVIAGEYALTPVTGAIRPNLILHQAGLLRTCRARRHEYIDLAGSDAFTLVDRQCAHVFVNRGDAPAVADLFRGVDQIADIVVGRERAALGLDHPRAAPVILISQPDRWFAGHWWPGDAKGPSPNLCGTSPNLCGTSTHAHGLQPVGYDPLELFRDPSTGQVPLDTSLVKGSNGAPVATPQQRTVLITSHPHLLQNLPTPTRDTDVFRLLCAAFNLHP